MIYPTRGVPYTYDPVIIDPNPKEYETQVSQRDDGLVIHLVNPIGPLDSTTKREQYGRIRSES